MYERGIEGMRDAISNTAKYGDYTRGPRIVDERTRETMRKMLREIQDGPFAQEWAPSTPPACRSSKCRERLPASTASKPSAYD